MYSLNTISSFQIVRPESTYVYDIVAMAGGLAVISSDDSLRLLDPLALNAGPVKEIHDVQKGVTCLQAIAQNNIVATAGRDGRACLWDPRAGDKVGEVQSGEFFGGCFGRAVFSQYIVFFFPILAVASLFNGRCSHLLLFVSCVANCSFGFGS